MKAGRPAAALKVHALFFGLFLGLCIWKFGEPVILERVIGTPATLPDLLGDAWPTHWANWLLLPLVLWGAALLFQHGVFPTTTAPQLRWLGLPPLIWLAWQFAAAPQSVAADLTAATLWQFSGCVACYFLGFFLFAREQLVRWLLAGALAAFVFCLVRGVDQHLFEYPQNYQELVDGERTGWTNFTPAMVLEMKGEGLIVTTNNGAEVANPAILAKFAKGRVCGTLVYPNALAEIILLLWPVSLALAWGATKQFRPFVRTAVIGLAVFLGGATFFWTGSKLGWLLAVGLAGVVLLRLNWPRRLKLATVAALLVVGLGLFAVRFHHYFAAGATSLGARFDYWRAAGQITVAHPVFGTGPGTFGRPYAQIKAPESEMARLTHNDYLEQFSDSGIPGGLAYLAWIILAFIVLARKIIWPKPVAPPTAAARKSLITAEEGSGDESGFNEHLRSAIFLGLLGWFAQGFGEFGLYVPALAWTAFTLLGCLLGQSRPKQV